MDDFNGVDADDLVDSAFNGFADFFQLMGLCTTPSKAQEPWRTHVIQGVQVTFSDEGATLEPTSKRLAKIVAIIHQILDQGILNFANQSKFGKVGRAAISPIYARASANSGDRTDLTPGLRAALLATKALLQQVPPRFIPFTAPRAVSCLLYAGLLPGGRASTQSWVGASQRPDVTLPAGVKRLGLCRAATWYDSGSIPDWFIRKFDTRRANIYMLEVLAQILAVVTLSDHLPEDWVAFIDNAAGQWALNKGYGRESSVNGLLSAFWSMASLQSWRPTFFRVTSEANIADPISRADCTLAIRHGWKQANTKLDAILDILAWAADDLEYAVHRAGSDLGDL